MEVAKESPIVRAAMFVLPYKHIVSVLAFAILTLALLVDPSHASVVKTPTFKLVSGTIIIALVLLQPITGLLLGIALAVVLMRVHQYDLHKSMGLLPKDRQRPSRDISIHEKEEHEESEHEESEHKEHEHEEQEKQPTSRMAHAHLHSLPPPSILSVSPSAVQIESASDLTAFISKEWLEKAQSNRVGTAPLEDAPFSQLSRVDKALPGLNHLEAPFGSW